MTAYTGGLPNYSTVKDAHLLLTDQAGTAGFLVTAKAKLDDVILQAGNIVETYSTNAGVWKSPNPIPAIDTSAATTYSSSANSALDTMPATAGLETNMGGASSAYASLGSPPSQVGCTSAHCQHTVQHGTRCR